jgi:hypothetical protein
MQGRTVHFREDRNRTDAHFAASADNTDRYFTTVGDKDLFEHCKNDDLSERELPAWGGSRQAQLKSPGAKQSPSNRRGQD